MQEKDWCTKIFVMEQSGTRGGKGKLPSCTCTFRLCYEICIVHPFGLLGSKPYSLALCIIPLCERLILAVRQQNFAGSYLPPISHDCNLSKPRLFDATAEPGNVAFHDVFMKKRETTRGQAIAIFIAKFVDRI